MSHTKKITLFDVLHKLIAQETAQMKALHPDSKTIQGKRDSLIQMRKLSKRDAYYRVIHILRGYDTEFPQERLDDICKLMGKDSSTKSI
jgi:hypothetical protein